MHAPTFHRISNPTSLDESHISGLCDLLINCVEGGASVGFMLPISRDRARTFWRRIAEDVRAGHRAILIAEDDLGICGTVQLVLGLPENQPHRAELVKLLVHARARRGGLGRSLMLAAENLARDRGRTLLVLDAVTNGDAHRLYTRLGWSRVGDVPEFALMPNGDPCGTTYFYKRLTRLEMD